MQKGLALLKSDISPGILLVAAAALALVLDNSSLAWLYDSLLRTPVIVQIGTFAIDKPLLLWVNDGLMAVFFFLIGLEIKRELIEGRLSHWRTASLPAIAAVGGMAVPALIYVALNYDDPARLSGWAIPAATDIAFALGILALLGRRVPAEIKIFLLALAILDDLGAILIIALFYTTQLSLISLVAAGIGLATLLTLNLRGITRIAPYIVVGVFMWVFVLKSGVHATLAGVAIALTIPLRSRNGQARSPLVELEHALHPWVAFLIMPAFAFANAGVPLSGLSFTDLMEPVPLGIAAGLFVGKQLGVFAFAWAGVRIGLARLPQGVTWAQLYGAGLLAGIGFTMSLFIGTLAFADPQQATAVRLGVLIGSTLSAVSGYLMLVWATRSAATEVTPRPAPASSA